MGHLDCPRLRRLLRGGAIDLTTYKRLFVHRADVFAEQHESGAYTPVRRPLTDEDIEEHLAGFWSIGTYVVQPPVDSTAHTVTSVVFDLDTHDENLSVYLRECVQRTVALCQSHESIEQRGFPMLMCESSGNKGTHVWLFFSGPIEAAKVRRWLGQTFLPEWTAATDGATLEIFPKQDEVPDGGFGNLVKLPFGVHRVSGKRSEIVVQQGWANAIEEVQPLGVELVPDLPPVTQTASRRGGRTQQSDGPSSPFPCIDLILYEGAGQGQRNQAMFHLALYCYGHAVPEDLALEMCQRSNEEFDPPLKDREVQSIIDQAYSGRYVSANCGQDWLRGFCPKELCRVGWQVAADKKAEGGTLRKAHEGTLVEVTVLRKSSEDGRTRLTIGHPDAANNPTLICE